MNKLYDWQKKAINNLKANNYNGIICAITGSGKSLVGVTILQRLGKSTLIIVPTVALMQQWKDDLLKNHGYTIDDVGLYYGLVKQKKKITIAVINSIYKEQGLGKEFDLLILDEIHRYAASEFQRLLLNNTFRYNIGLTATLERNDGNHKLLINKIGDVVYEYSTSNAVQDKLLNEFTIVCHGLDLPKKELEYLTRLDVDIKALMNSFGNDINRVTVAIKNGNRTAGNVLRLISKRKKFYNNSLPKVDEAIKLIANNNDNKIIVFGEYTETIDVLYRKLKNIGINSYVYYSGNKETLFNLKAKDKRELLDNFRNADNGVLLTVKALDEGLNVVDLELAICLGYNKTARQAIQRMGRILRKQDNKHPTMHLFYYRKTSDAWNIKSFVRNFEGSAKIIWQ